MKNLLLIFSLFFLSNCRSKIDLEEKLYNKDDLQNDIRILKGIVSDMHAGAYTYNSPQMLNNLFDSVRTSIKYDIDLRTFYTKVDFILDRIKCIHTDAYFPDDFYDTIYKRKEFFPVPLMVIDNKLIVNNENLLIPLGAEIQYINNIPADNILKNLKRFLHTDGNSDVIRNEAINENFALNFYKAYGGFPSFSLRYKRDSSITPEYLNFEAESLNTLNVDKDFLPYYDIQTDVSYDLEIIDNKNTAILSLTSFNFETLNTYNAFLRFLENSFRLIKQNNIKNLIIDCRENGGGQYNSTYSALSYLVNKNLYEFDSSFQRFKFLSYKKFISPKDTSIVAEEDTAYLKYDLISNNRYKLKKEEITEWIPKDYIFRGNLFLLINGNVASATSTFAAILKDKTNVIVVGEESGGSNYLHNSSVINFTLPNSKINVDIPLRSFYQPNNKIILNRGVIPNKEISLTVKDLINSEDKQLNYIFDSLIIK